MKTTIQKWGNSLALRIPRVMAFESGVHAGSVVDLESKAGILTLKAARSKPNLKKLLAGIKSGNLHAETHTGPAVGREIW